MADHIAFFESKGLGVVSASPLAMGLLTPQGPPAWHPAPPPLRAAVDAALTACAAEGEDLPALAVSFSLREPRIATTLVGMASVREVEANVETALQALGVGGRGLGERGEALLRRLRGEVFAAVEGTTWPSGRPENN